MNSRKVHQAQRLLEEANATAPPGHKMVLFSGGKDSIVASHLANRTLGITTGFCETALLPVKTIDEIKSIAKRMGFVISFHEELNRKTFQPQWDNQLCNPKWKPSTLDSVRHWKSIPRYAKQVNAGLMIFGRRLQENTVPSPIYFKKGLKALQCHPIYDWTHDEVWSYIKHHGLQYPSCYEDGSKHLFTWISLAEQVWQKTKSRKEVYRVIYQYAPEFLIERAKTDEVAAVYLNEIIRETT